MSIPVIALDLNQVKKVRELSECLSSIKTKIKALEQEEVDARKDLKNFLDEVVKAHNNGQYCELLKEPCKHEGGGYRPKYCVELSDDSKTVIILPY